MSYLAVNAASSVLSASATSTATTLTVQDTSALPNPGAGNYYFLTLASSPVVFETVLVTGVSGATLTVVRGCKGTLPQAWSAGVVATTAPPPALYDHPWLLAEPFRPPNPADLTWVNQGTSTFIQARGGSLLTQAGVGATNGSFLVKAYSGTVTVDFIAMAAYATGNFSICLVVRDSGTGKFVEFGAQGTGLDQVTPGFRYTYWNSPSSASSVPAQVTWGVPSPLVMRFVDDGTNFNFYASAAGQNWLPVFSPVSRTAFLATPNQIGFGAISVDSASRSVFIPHWYAR